MASILKVDKIRGTGLDSDSLSIDGSGNISTIKTFSAPGHVIQTLQSQKTDTFTTSSVVNSGGYVDITGLSINITPASSSSKFLVMAKVSGMIWNHGHTFFRLLRDSTTIGVATGTGNRIATFSSTGTGDSWATADHVTSCLDSPNTASQITYKVQGACEYGALYVNRSSRDTDAWYDARTTSEITVMEIAQ